jgi:hypothetical protein
VATNQRDKYSAAEQGLGYLYQHRYALFKAFDYEEDAQIFLERHDDIDAESAEGAELMSLKHKAEGDRLTNLSTDFWKSVRIWCERYKAQGRAASRQRYFLVTTASIAAGSELRHFSVGATKPEDFEEELMRVLGESTAAVCKDVIGELSGLTVEERSDFFARICIVDASPRIDRLPERIMSERMRTVRREHRSAVFERLEGWWSDQATKLLTGERTEPLVSAEVSDKLAAIADEYKHDNLPITFADKDPDESEFADDDRLFIRQLREIGLSDSQLRYAVIDFYRAFQQRSEWARRDLLVSDEISRYEKKLAEEWDRYREAVCGSFGGSEGEEVLIKAGRAIFNWAQGAERSFRIRDRVSEPFVHRGSFHMLANETPKPRVYWHPQFLTRLGAALGASA